MLFETLIDLGLDALMDSLRVIPFLYVTYLVLEYLEQKATDRTVQAVQKAGRFGPLIGGAMGALPHGFSAVASGLYAGRVITLGTLLAIYMSTSDEMLPVLIAESVPVGVLVKILLTKVLLGVATGYLIDLLLFRRKREADIASGEAIHEVCDHDHCHCERGIFYSALVHTVKIFIFIFALTLVLNAVIAAIGEDNLKTLLVGQPLVGELLAGVIGLIPNCAASVIITELYLEGVLGSGPMISGLLVSAGVGFLVLFRQNRHLKENLQIIGILYVCSIFWGLVIHALGISFV